MFADYQAQVLLTYQKKREAGQLSLNLSHPSPAKLRTECVLVLRDRYSKSDDRIIRDFFELSANESDYAQTIGKFDVDKFRPLVNFINRKTGEPVRKQVELLAWLIDFESRPYKFDQSITDKAEGIKATLDGPKENLEDKTPIAEKDTFRQLPLNLIGKRLHIIKFRGLLLILVILAFFGGATYWLRDKMITGGCAIWTGDQYRSVPCDQQAGDTAVVVVDKQRLTQFKMITKPDTLSTYSIEKVWYFKRNDSLELYTAKGHHPVHPERELKKLTDYMYRKYILQKKFYISGL